MKLLQKKKSYKITKVTTQALSLSTKGNHMAGIWSNLVKLKTTFCNFNIFHVGMAHWTDMILKKKIFWKNGKNWKSKILCHLNLKIA